MTMTSSPKAVDFAATTTTKNHKENKDNDTRGLDLLALLPYTKANFGKSNAAFREQVLVPRKKRLESNQSPERKKKASPSCIKARRSKRVTEEDIKSYEEYFRQSKYFQATGKLPDEWLIHFTDEQLVEVKKARERVLKEKESSGEEAWKTWVNKKKSSTSLPPARGADKKGSILSEEERDEVWRNWKAKKDKQLAEQRQEQRKMRERLIAEAMSPNRFRKHPPQLPTDNKATAHAQPKRSGSHRKRLPSAVQVALCQSAVSPYLIHPALPYKKENIRALEELQEIREMNWKLGGKKRLPLPEMWKRRVERVQEDIGRVIKTSHHHTSSELEHPGGEEGKPSRKSNSAGQKRPSSGSLAGSRRSSSGGQDNQHHDDQSSAVSAPEATTPQVDPPQPPPVEVDEVDDEITTNNNNKHHITNNNNGRKDSRPPSAPEEVEEMTEVQDKNKGPQQKSAETGYYSDDASFCSEGAPPDGDQEVLMGRARPKSQNKTGSRSSSFQVVQQQAQPPEEEGGTS